MVPNASSALALTTLALLALPTSAHPGEPDPRRTTEQLNQSLKRINSGRRCASQAADQLHRRMSKRGHASGQVSGSGLGKRWEPTYDRIQNETCVLAPEIMEGPFWISHILMRQNLTDEEPGLPLLLDIGVMDVNTCAPLADVGVDIWTVNATGHYSGFSNNEGGGGGGPGGPGGPHGPGGPTGGRPPWAPPHEDLVPLHSYPSLAEGVEIEKEKNGGWKEPDLPERFLRGFWPTNKHGVAELALNYPGWYSGRNPHIHLKIHTHWGLTKKGYITGGGVTHTGQIFFDDELSDLVYKWGIYATREGRHKRNEEDHTFEEAAQDGFDPVIKVRWVDEEDISKGLIGYLTVGVDAEAGDKVAEEAGLNVQF